MQNARPDDDDDGGESMPLVGDGGTLPVSSSIRRRLYTSHFLSTWNSRAFEFGAILFIAKTYPSTLLPASIYALVRAGSAACLAPAIGRYIDRANRLQVARVSIVVQRVAAVVSCLGFWVLAVDVAVAAPFATAVQAALVLLACVEKLCSIMNMVAIERDWVVVIAGDSERGLQALNSQMRRIDLFCKLAGPLVISLVDGISTTLAIWVTLGTQAAFVTIEYFAIAEVYNLVPALQLPRSLADLTAQAATAQTAAATPQTASGTATACPLRPAGLRAWLRSACEPLALYVRHAVFLPSLAISLLYLTVLNFAGQMVTYLLSVGYSSAQIGLLRTMSVVVELSATWLAPLAMRRAGPLRAGLWFVSLQVACLAAVVSAFFVRSDQAPFATAAALLLGVIASRAGLWGFDLCVQIVVQEEVEEEIRGAFSSVEAALQNAFELCSYATTIVFSRPDQFRYPVLISAVAVATAGALYAHFVRSRRGHLLHFPACADVLRKANARQASWRHARPQ